MAWGAIFSTAIRVLLMWLENRFDPEMIKLRELKDIRHAKEDDIEAIDKAIADGNAADLSDIWRRLSPH